MYAAKVIADSSALGVRLTTMEVVFPRFILAEFNTHRMLSRNSASSRAIPVKRRVAQVREAPFVPDAFLQNKAGMQADTIEVALSRDARIQWEGAAADACAAAERLAVLDVHKQWANRLIEPFAWHTVVVTATEWANYFALRISPYAQPEIVKVSTLMRDALAASTPTPLEHGEWHLPYTTEQDIEAILDVTPPERVRADVEKALVKISVARCAAVSYERQNADKPLADLYERHDMLRGAGHMSPFEHQAQVIETDVGRDVGVVRAPFSPLYEVKEYGDGSQDWEWVGDFCGNFRAPFLQYRKTLPGERVYRGV